MNEKERVFIESLFAKQGEQFQQQLQHALAETSQRFEQQLLEAKTDFKQHVSSVAESFDHKIALLSEGHESLVQRVDRIDEKLDRLDSKMDKMEMRLSHQINKVVSDLAEHIADPDAHSRGYRVKEDGPTFTAGDRIDLVATVDEMSEPEPEKKGA